MNDTVVENSVFLPNSARYLAEHAGDLRGKHVAWALDGKSVLATAPTLAELYATMATLGREDFVSDYIDPPSVVVASVPLSRAS